MQEPINRQLGNLFMIFTRNMHCIWGAYVKPAEACLNETYHETIEVTAFEVQFGRRQERIWNIHVSENILKEIATNSTVNQNNIHLKIKRKRKNATKRVNDAAITFSEFQEENVHHKSDAMLGVIAKFAEIYKGPYHSYHIQKIGDSNYVIGDNTKKEK